MRAILAATALAASLVLVSPVAGQAEEDEDTAAELTVEAMDRLLRALDLLLGSIPQYEAPYVNENGDIIIRRKHPERELPTPEHKPAPPDVDTTTT